MSDQAQPQARLKTRLERWAKLSLLPPVGAALVWGIAATMRLETRGQEEVDAVYRSGGHIILAFWHAQQLMIPSGYRGTGAHVLISQHGDGEIIARIIARFGHEAVRGSSTRGEAGHRAIGEGHRTADCPLSLCLLNQATLLELGPFYGPLSLLKRSVSLWKADVRVAGNRRSRARNRPPCARSGTQSPDGRG